jgi:hypothetical protein
MDEQQLHRAKIRSRSVSAYKDLRSYPIAAHGDFLLFEHPWSLQELEHPDPKYSRDFTLTNVRVGMADFEQPRIWHFDYYAGDDEDDEGIGGDGAKELAKQWPEIAEWVLFTLRARGSRAFG